MRRAARGLVRAVVTAGLFLIVFRFLDWTRVWRLASGAAPGWVAVAVLAQVASTTLASYRWKVVMRELGSRCPWRFCLASYFRGAFFGQFLPGGVGGDVVRVIDVVRAGGERKNALLGVFLDRLSAFPGLALLGLGALAVSGPFPESVRTLSLALEGSVLAGFTVATQLDRISFTGRIRLLHPLVRVSQGLRTLYGTPGRLAMQCGLSVGVHTLTIVATASLAVAVGMNAPLGAFFALLPLATLATVLPISLAGWGVREGAMVGLFGLIGVAGDQTLTVSILTGAVALVASLPGLAAWLGQRRRPR